MKIKKIKCIPILFFLLSINCLNTFANENKKMELNSNAFENNGNIPKTYTCEGSDISPSLSWGNIPSSTKSLVLIVDDPDAPAGTWVHWIVYNIPKDAKGFKENLPKEKKLADGSIQGITDFKRSGYGGPCPPSGIHRYFFKLYALDTNLNLKDGSTKKDVEAAMEGHILSQAEIMGKYKRS